MKGNDRSREVRFFMGRGERAFWRLLHQPRRSHAVALAFHDGVAKVAAAFVRQDEQALQRVGILRRDVAGFAYVRRNGGTISQMIPSLSMSLVVACGQDGPRYERRRRKRWRPRAMPRLPASMASELGSGMAMIATSLPPVKLLPEKLA